MAVMPQDKSVTIDGETFSVLEVPDVKSNLAVKAKESNCFQSFDLESFVDDLGNLGRFIRIAYNGVAGNTELQIKVQQLGYEITKLTDESAVTVHKFKQTSSSALQELQVTYQFLLDGLEEIALGNLTSMANLAKDMMEDATNLETKLGKATQNVTKLLQETQRNKGEWENLKQRQEKFELGKEKAEALQQEATKAMEKAEQHFEQAQKREEETIQKQDSFFHAIKQALVRFLTSKKEDTDYKEIIRAAKAEKMKHLKEKQEYYEKKKKALKECMEFAAKAKQCKTDEGIKEVVIAALHNSVGALKNLSTIMMNASFFWKLTYEQCKSLSSQHIQETINNAMKCKAKKERIEVWTSDGFKTQTMQYYAKWVALDDLCGTCMKQIKETRKDLYRYLQENPTVEESRKKVPQLLAEYEKYLKEKHD